MGKVSSDQVDEMVRLYQSGFSLAKIAPRFEVDYTTVHWWLEKRNIPRREWGPRTHEFNDRIFDIVDTEAKAYWLGFLYADGYNGEKRGTVKVTLQKRDEAFLEKMKDFFGYKWILKPHSVISKNDGKTRYYSTLYMNSKHLSSRCKSLGFYQNKSLTLRFPSSDQVPNNLVRHFVRGYFDGDGCISFNPEKFRNATLELTSSPFFIETLCKILTEKGLTVYSKLHANKITRTLKLCRFTSRVDFINWIYQDATVFLDRKRDKCMAFKECLIKKITNPHANLHISNNSLE